MEVSLCENSNKLKINQNDRDSLRNEILKSVYFPEKVFVNIRK